MEAHRIVLFILLFAIMALTGLSATGPAGEELLAAHRWRHRLLLIFTGNDPTPLGEQMYLLDADPGALAERDLKLFQILPEGGRTPDERPLTASQAIDLRRRYQVGPGFTVVLIGKDGTEKLRRTAPLSPDELFDTIDAMPMRQREQRGQ